MTTTRGRGHSAGLSREQVVESALGLLSDGGADAISMRALAARLGVTPNAIYAHVASKDELIDLLLDEVLGEVRAVSPEAADPQAALSRMMASTYTTLIRHRGLVGHFLARQGSRGPNAVELGRVMDVLLARIGVDDIGTARQVLIVHAIGSAAFATTGSEAGRAVSERRARGNFDAGLRWLLTGVTAPRAPL